MKIDKVPRDKIIIEPIDEHVTKAGIVHIDDKGDPVQEGYIVGVGTKIKDPNVKIGKRILFQRPAGFEFRLDSKNLLWIKFEHAIAVYE